MDDPITRISLAVNGVLALSALGWLLTLAVTVYIAVKTVRGNFVKSEQKAISL